MIQAWSIMGIFRRTLITSRAYSQVEDHSHYIHYHSPYSPPDFQFPYIYNPAEVYMKLNL